MLRLFAFSFHILLLLSQINVGARNTEDIGFCDKAGSCGVKEDYEMFKRMGQGTGKVNTKAPEFYSYKTLDEFGYKFNEKGQLKNKETGEKFQFEVKKGDRSYNQKHYEALGEIITKHVYQLLETTTHLRKVSVPLDAKKQEVQGFIFMSENALTADKLMVLIHGSGVVRAGQWARSLIINDCLDSGTMLPYISRAQKEGYGVLVTNGNENLEWKDGKSLRIRGSESPENHFAYVWNHFISRAAARDIAMVAHSYGGVVVVHAMKTCKDAMSRVKAVAFTDSVHSLGYQGADENLRKWFKKHTRNWVSANLPLDTPIKSQFVSTADSDRVSAGTVEHVWTSCCAFNSVFKFFNERLKRTSKSSSAGGNTSDDKKKRNYEEMEKKLQEPESSEELKEEEISEKVNTSEREEVALEGEKVGEKVHEELKEEEIPVKVNTSEREEVALEEEKVEEKVHEELKEEEIPKKVNTSEREEVALEGEKVEVKVHEELKEEEISEKMNTSEREEVALEGEKVEKKVHEELKEEEISEKGNTSEREEVALEGEKVEEKVHEQVDAEQADTVSPEGDSEMTTDDTSKGEASGEDVKIEGGDSQSDDRVPPDEPEQMDTS